MTVLATGAAGYIGSVVAAALLSTDVRVVVYDDLSNGHECAVPAGARFIKGELGDRALLCKVSREYGITAVLQFAGSIEAGESMRVSEKYFQNNTVNSLTLLEALLECGVGKFIYSSSAAVYGAPAFTPITEDHSPAPTNAYAESKFMVEKMLFWFYQTRGSGDGFSLWQVIAATERVTGRPIAVEEWPRRPADPPIQVASSEKINQELGWIPRQSGLENIIGSREWRCRNPHGYGKAGTGRRA